MATVFLKELVELERDAQTVDTTSPANTYITYHNQFPGSASVPVTSNPSDYTSPSSYLQGIKDTAPGNAILYDGSSTGPQSQSNTIINCLPVYAPPLTGVTAPSPYSTANKFPG